MSILASLPSFKTIGYLFAETFKRWNAKDPFQLSAAVSYYALFSFPALIIIVIQTVGIFYKRATIKSRIIEEISKILGSDSAEAVEAMLANAINTESSGIAIIVGIATLLYGATGLFVALQKALNIIWGVVPKPKNEWLKLIKDRAFSLGLILIIGFLLLTSLILTAILTAISDYIALYLPEVMINLFQVVNFIVALALVTVLFAMIFKFLPDVTLRWRTVWFGAIVTAILFSIGKSALGIYFGTADPGSAFGAAGSVILILLWVSYSSLILFFGAAFTQVYAEHYGQGIQPAPYAERID